MGIRWDGNERRKGERRKGTTALPERREFVERRGQPRLTHEGSESEARVMDGNR